MRSCRLSRTRCFISMAPIRSHPESQRTNGRTNERADKRSDSIAIRRRSRTFFFRFPFSRLTAGPDESFIVAHALFRVETCTVSETRRLYWTKSISSVGVAMQPKRRPLGLAAGRRQAGRQAGAQHACLMAKQRRCFRCFRGGYQPRATFAQCRIVSDNGRVIRL